MFKNGLPLVITMTLFSLALMGCGVSSAVDPDPQATRVVELAGTIEALESRLQTAQDAEAEEPLPFEGLWVSESDDPEKTGQILSISRDSFYALETYSPSAADYPPAAREMFAEIQSYDLENNHITLRIRWLRTNGVMGGSNVPTALVTYAIDEDAIQIAVSRSGEGQFPVEAGTRRYLRK